MARGTWAGRLLGVTGRGWQRMAAAVGFAALGTTAGWPASAEEFPSRPITMVVPLGPGGGSDQVARALAEAMEETDDLRFQIENKPGGAGVIGSIDALGRPADGYTILQGTDGLISSIATGKVQARLGADVVPLCLTQSTFSQLYVRADDARFASFDDVAAAGRRGRLTMANSSRPGSYEEILARSLAEILGLRFEQINFDNPSERYGALLGGQVDLLFEQPGDIRPYLDAEQFRPVLTFMQERPETFPDTPSLPEVGAAGVPRIERVRGLFIRADVPEDRQRRLADACARAYATDDYQEVNAEQYMDEERSFRDRATALAVARELERVFRDALAKSS